MGMEISQNLILPNSELVISFIRASGPGGQNVNKVATAVQLRFDVRNSPSLTEDIKARLVKLAGNKMTLDGVLVIEAKRYRTQQQNHSDAEQRLETLVLKALVIPKRRRPTHATAASQARRIRAKLRKGKTKRLRQSTDD